MLDIALIEAAKAVSKRFEAVLLGRITGAGIADSAYRLEVTSCGNAEGPAFAWRSDCVYLEQISVFQVGQGTGRTIMRLALELADEEGLTVILEASSQKFDERNPWWRERLSPKEIADQAFRLVSLSQEALEAWYGRLGFEPVDEDGVLLRRMPRPLVPRPG